MKTVLKYQVQLGVAVDQEELLREWSIETYEDALFLDIQMNFGQPVMWMLVDTEKPRESRRFRIFATGEPMPSDDETEVEYYGTLQVNRGEWVWHLFELL